MVEIQWGTLIYQLVFILMLVGVPIVVILILRSRKSKMKELEQRIQKLEKDRQNEV